MSTNVGAVYTFENGVMFKMDVGADGQIVKKQVTGEELQKLLNGMNQGQKPQGDMNVPGLSVERQSAQLPETGTRLTGLDYASNDDGVMKTKKEYKEMRKERQAELYLDLHKVDDNYSNKMAKKQAKQSVEVTKAADRVLSSVYYTDKAAYDKAKKADKEAGKRPVLLTESDMEMLKDQNWDKAFVGRERDAKGNITKEGKLDSDMLKQLAAERIGMDNEVEMEERVSETAAMADEVGLKNGKVTHNKARKTKNLYKHLGFDYQKDQTELKRAAYVVGTTLTGGLAGKGLQHALGKEKGVGMSPGGTVETENVSKVFHNGVLTSEMHIPKVIPYAGQAIEVSTLLGGLKATGLGALVGAGIGLATMGNINDLKNKKNDILQGQIGSLEDAVKFVQKGDVMGIKKERNQIMMKGIIQEAKAKGISDEQLGLAILGARGDNGCLTEKELNTLYKSVKEYEPQPVPEPTPEPTPTPTVEPGPSPVPTPTPAPSVEPEPTPAPEECWNEQEKDVYKKIPVPKFRTGNWYISHAYVNDDGSKLSEADRRAVQRALASAENRIGEVREHNRRTGIQLADTITLPSGKVVKVADDAYARIMRLPARGGGRDAKYNTQKHGTMYRAVDCTTGQAKTPWMNKSDFDKWTAEHGHKS